MNEPTSILREMLSRYEDSVLMKEQELESFRARAAAHIMSLEADLAKHRDTVESLRARVAEHEETVESVEPITHPRLFRKTEPGRGRQTRVIREFLHLELEREGMPLSRHEIKERLERAGFKFDTANLSELIRAALNRDPCIKHISGVGYTFR